VGSCKECTLVEAEHLLDIGCPPLAAEGAVVASLLRYDKMQEWVEQPHEEDFGHHCSLLLGLGSRGGNCVC
jgi:hypothetical protein